MRSCYDRSLALVIIDEVLPACMDPSCVISEGELPSLFLVSIVLVLSSCVCSVLGELFTSRVLFLKLSTLPRCLGKSGFIMYSVEFIVLFTLAFKILHSCLSVVT